MTQQTRIAVLMGGISTEHDVSMRSGAMVLGALRNMPKYQAFPVVISKENHWIWPPENDVGPWDHAFLVSAIQKTPAHWQRISFPLFNSMPQADLYFLGLHGLGGEDGRLQGFLDLAGIPYTGSRMTGSALAMDKILAKEQYISHFIPTAPYHIHTTKIDKIIPPKFGYPCVVKDPWGGSSIGTKVVHNRDEYLAAIEELSPSCPCILVEKFIAGIEATCGYLENGPTLPPTEIVPPDTTFFDYTSKYDGKSTKEITPGRFSPEITQRLQALAKECHDVLRLSGVSRTDFIISGNDIHVLETNTLPGMTGQSLLPQAANAAGLSFADLIDFLIQQGFKSTWKAKR